MECHTDSLHPGKSDKEATAEITLLDVDIKMADSREAKTTSSQQLI